MGIKCWIRHVDWIAGTFGQHLENINILLTYKNFKFSEFHSRHPTKFHFTVVVQLLYPPPRSLRAVYWTRALGYENS